MIKKFKTTARWMMGIIILLSACKDDFSSLDVNKIPGISIDTTGNRELTVFRFEQLEVDPVVDNEGIAETSLSYQWEVNLAPGSIEYVPLGTERKLAAEISLPPTLNNERYQLQLTITDDNTGLQYLMGWPLVVRNSIGQGLVIAETYDGVTTDVSHLMSPLVTYSYTQESLKRKVFSTVNDFTLPGLNTQMLFSSFGTSSNILLGISNESIYTINTLDYTLGGQDEELFFVMPEQLKPQYIGGFRQGTTNVALLVNDNQLYGDVISLTKKFGNPFDFDYQIPPQVLIDPLKRNIVNFYDERLGRFVYLTSIQAFGDRNMYPLPSAESPFDPANLPNKSNVASSMADGDEMRFLMRDRSTDAYELYLLSRAYEVWDPNTFTYVTYPTIPIGYFNFAGAPEIDQAQHFAFLPENRVLLYATATKIYAIMYASSTPSYALRYTAPAGEEITGMQLFQQADYPIRDLNVESPYLPTNNRMVIVSTYDGTEGKLGLFPLASPSLGTFNTSGSKVYDGLGRILSVTPQM